MKTQMKVTLLAGLLVCAGNVFAAVTTGTTTPVAPAGGAAPAAPAGGGGGLLGGGTLEQINVTVNAAIGFNTCTGAGAVCPTAVTINAVGVPVTIDISTLQPLGTIDRNKTISIELPVLLGEQKVYSFTPTTGDMAGQKIIFALDNVKPTGRYAITGGLVNIYRRTGIPGQMWIDMGNFTGRISRLPEGTTASFDFATDGTMSLKDPTTGVV